MPLVSNYRRSDDDEDAGEEETSPLSLNTDKPKTLASLPETTKKRPASFAAEAAAKLLKLTENVGSDKVHSMDIASQMLDRNKEKNLQPKPASNSGGPRSLLDMLPTPKSASTIDQESKKLNEPTASEAIQEEEPQPRKQKVANVAPVPTAPTSLLVPKTLKTKSLSPDVKLDDTFSMEDPTEPVNSTNSAAPKAVGPKAPSVGPARPSYLRQLEDDEDDAPPALAPMDPVMAQHQSYAPSGPTHYDPKFGIIDGATQVVELDMNAVLQQASSGAAGLPSRPNFGAASRSANVSKTARGKNQITYLAAIANETERFMQEKRTEQARNKNRAGL